MAFLCSTPELPGSNSQPQIPFEYGGPLAVRGFLLFVMVRLLTDSSAQELVNWVDECCYSPTFDRTCPHKEARFGGSMDWRVRLRMGIGLLETGTEHPGPVASIQPRLF